ncbi:MAG TPA: methyl-accepting chemotaxis protein [Desulfosporosinus sp.]|nr:methyl-accepting chemotaxis protein [Desulfosporosinus sp.]
MFANMKVATKIIGYGFAMVFLIIFVGMVGGYYNLNSAESLRDMYENNLISIHVLDDSRNQGRAIEGSTVQLLQPQDPARRQKLLDDIKNRGVIFDKNLAVFEKAGLDAFEKETLALLRKQVADYRIVRARILALSGEGKYSEAYQLYIEREKDWEDVQGSLRKLVEYNIKEAKESDDENDANAKKAIWIMGSVVVFAMILAIALGMFIARLITKPLKLVLDNVNQIANGNLVVKEIDIPSKDEIGELAAGVSVMNRNLLGLIRQVSRSSQQLAAASEELTASAEQSAQAATQVASSIADVAHGAQMQLTAAGESSAIVEEMSASIEETAATANEISSQAAQAAEKANEGSTSVDAAIRQMASIESTVDTSSQVVARLGARSQEIGQIVETIAGIAGQTNLLALNAAIEAARAGEQGRGFAVVAEEVRKLAEQSQDAAKQIAQLIGEIQTDTVQAVQAMGEGTKEVKHGADVVNRAGIAFKEIVQLISGLSEQVREISAATEEMAGGSQQIVSSVQRIDQLSKQTSRESQTVSAATEEQAASMEEIASSSQTLAHLATELQQAVSRFKI